MALPSGKRNQHFQHKSTCWVKYLENIEMMIFNILNIQIMELITCPNYLQLQRGQPWLNIDLLTDFQVTEASAKEERLKDFGGQEGIRKETSGILGVCKLIV